MILVDFTPYRQYFSPQGQGPFWARIVWYQIWRNGSNSDLDKTLPTRFKRPKNQILCVICIIRRFNKIEQCFNYIDAKFQGAGFQNIGDTRHRSLDFLCLFLLGHLLVQVTWWFLASDGSEIQTSLEDFRPIN